MFKTDEKSSLRDGFQYDSMILDSGLLFRAALYADKRYQPLVAQQGHKKYSPPPKKNQELAHFHANITKTVMVQLF